MTTVAKSLRAKHPADTVYILCAERNSGYFTYDGVELGGERVCLEIEEELRAIEDRGGKIKKLSVVGYSAGGLVARYAIGLLHAKGVLDELECMVSLEKGQTGPMDFQCSVLIRDYAELYCYRIPLSGRPHPITGLRWRPLEYPGSPHVIHVRTTTFYHR